MGDIKPHTHCPICAKGILEDKLEHYFSDPENVYTGQMNIVECNSCRKLFAYIRMPKTSKYELFSLEPYEIFKQKP